MNIQRLLNDDDYFNEWFINDNLDSLSKLAQLQGYNHHLTIFFELNNINSEPRTQSICGLC